jgi:hypothetical protein
MAKCYTPPTSSYRIRTALIGATTEDEALGVLREALHSGNERYERIDLVRVLLSPQNAVPPGTVRWAKPAHSGSDRGEA